MKNALEDAARRAAEAHKQEVLSAVGQVQSSAFERAGNYTNIIIGAGFAGAFAVWSLAGDLLTKTQRAWVGLLLLFSLLVFVFWEVIKMIYYGVMAHRFAALMHADPMQIDAVLKEQQNSEAEQTQRLGMIWARVVLPLTILPALGAACLLAYAFVSQIVFG